VVGDRLDHEVRAITKIGVGAEEDGANANGFEAHHEKRMTEHDRHFDLFTRDVGPGLVWIKESEPTPSRPRRKHA